MAFLARENIAMPDAVKDQLIFKWPDLEIRKYSACIVEGDYQALFTLQGEIKQVIDRPGRYGLNATELPGLGIIIDAVTGNRRFRAELYYISRRELLDKFGGPVDNVEDPVSQIPVRLTTYGEYMVRIADPQKLIYKITGTQNVPDNGAITDMTDEFVLTALRQSVVAKINDGTWKIFGLAGYTADIQKAVCERANESAADYGLEITRLPQFSINLDEQSRAEIEQFYQRRSAIGLASAAGGNYERAAAAAVQFGAGEGLAQGGGASAPLLYGVGMGAVQQGQNQPPPPPPTDPRYAGYRGPNGPAGGSAAAPAAPALACPSCGASNAASAKFCNACGASMAPAAAPCPACGAANPAGAMFCSACGKPMASAAPAVAEPEPAAPSAAVCAGCGAELGAQARFCAACGRAVE